ncbi:hypothetical protein J6590_046124 [Homalodisca vitripennis]|nr:hypothetical protein J6590_046124 [Homalodisca vitripennis]
MASTLSQGWPILEALSVGLPKLPFPYQPTVGFSGIGLSLIVLANILLKKELLTDEATILFSWDSGKDDN